MLAPINLQKVHLGRTLRSASKRRQALETLQRRRNNARTVRKPPHEAEEAKISKKKDKTSVVEFAEHLNMIPLHDMSKENALRGTALKFLNQVKNRVDLHLVRFGTNANMKPSSVMNKVRTNLPLLILQ